MIFALLTLNYQYFAHYPSQRNWWIVHIYGIPVPEQVGIFFRGSSGWWKLVLPPPVVDGKFASLTLPISAEGALRLIKCFDKCVGL